MDSSRAERFEGLQLWQADPNPKLIRVDGLPCNSDGAEVKVSDGPPISEKELHFFIRSGRDFGDFVGNLPQLLIVSANCWHVIKSTNVPSIQAIPATLHRRNGKAIDLEYFWLNVGRSENLLDEERSTVRRTKSGLLQSIERYVVRSDFEPTEDLFLCGHTSSTIFTGNLASGVSESGLTGAQFRTLEGGPWPYW